MRSMRIRFLSIERRGAGRGGRDPINITSFSVTSHELFPCNAKLERDESRLKNTRCIGVVPLATRRVSFQARWRSQYKSQQEGISKRAARRWGRRTGRNGPKDGVWWNRRTRRWWDTTRWKREKSRQLVQTNREWRDTYFVAHVFWHQPPWETSAGSFVVLVIVTIVRRHRRCRLTARSMSPPTKPTTGDNCLSVWGCARRSNPWPSRDGATKNDFDPKKNRLDLRISLYFVFWARTVIANVWYMYYYIHVWVILFYDNKFWQ